MGKVASWTAGLPLALREFLLKANDPRRPANVVATAMQLSEQLAVHLGTLIGEEGARARCTGAASR